MLNEHNLLYTSKTVSFYDNSISRAKKNGTENLSTYLNKEKDAKLWYTCKLRYLTTL